MNLAQTDDEALETREVAIYVKSYHHVRRDNCSWTSSLLNQNRKLSNQFYKQRFEYVSLKTLVMTVENTFN